MQNLGCGCGKPGPSAYLCKSCGDNSSCLGCDGVAFSGKTDVGCGCGVAKKADGCCPGLFKYAADNSCKTSAEICQNIFYQMVQVNTTKFHPLSTPNTKVTSALYHMTATGAVAFQSANDVKGHSSCIYRAMEQCSPQSVGRGGGNVVDMALWSRWSNGDIDECVANTLRSWSPQSVYQGASTHFGVTTDVWSTVAYIRRDASGGCGAASSWMVSLRDQLNCSVLNYHFHDFASPVSLLWTDDVNIDEVVSYSEFPLNPSDKAQTMLWRGSSMTPLLVYDPLGKGSIESAEQLFGNHTFGKKWRDGYEALASLDTAPKNGWLENEELGSIALWFDHNRDGVTQQGEVRQLADVGITAIGVKADRKDEATKSVFAQKGFRRSIEGREYIGRSVDWFGAPARARGKEAGIEQKPAPMASLEDFKLSKGGDLDITTSMHGVWTWEVTDDAMLLPQQRPGGMFAVTQEGDRLRGVSVSSAMYRPNAYGIDEKVDSKRLIGVARSEKVFEFIISNSDGGTTKSTAKLSTDGMKLIGETTQEFKDGSKLDTMTYHWEGSRVTR